MEVEKYVSRSSRYERSGKEDLIVPESSRTSAEELYQMVCKVNRTEVSVDDFLTDNVYYYNREKNTLNAFVEAE